MRCSRSLAVVLPVGRPVMPGCRSEVSNVSMMIPWHSAMARLERKPTLPANTVGMATEMDGPLDAKAYIRPAKGKSEVKMTRRTRWDDHTTDLWNVMLSVRCR